MRKNHWFVQLCCWLFNKTKHARLNIINATRVHMSTFTVLAHGKATAIRMFDVIYNQYGHYNGEQVRATERKMTPFQTFYAVSLSVMRFLEGSSVSILLWKSIMLKFQ